MSSRPSTILNTLTILLVTASMHTVGCAPNEDKADHSTVFTQLEQEVYAAILAQHFGKSSYVLMNQTRNWDVTFDLEEDENSFIIQNLGGLSPELLLSLRSKNRQSQLVPNDLALGAPYSLLDQATLMSLINPDNGYSENGFWKGLITRFPGAPGVLTIARVGFDVSGQHALAFLRWKAGPLAMTMRYYLLERKGDTWTIVADVITVVS